MKNIMSDKYKTLPIGTIFTYKGNKYKVCKDDNYCWICSKCAFKKINCDTLKHIRGNCGLNTRTDHNSVYFVQINDDTTMNKACDNISVINPIFNTNDSLKNLRIDCPKGYSIDVEHSDLSKGIIRFKNSGITLEDIYENQGKDTFVTNVVSNNTYTYNKIFAIATLLDIANYYNKGWKPDWNNDIEFKYYIVFDYFDDMYKTKSKSQTCNNTIYFAHREDAQKVIDNPNFRDILDTIYKD